MRIKKGTYARIFSRWELEYIDLEKVVRMN